MNSIEIHFRKDVVGIAALAVAVIGVIAAWATASQCFRFLLDGLPAAACVAIGILSTLAFGALVDASQWTRIVDAVWTRDAPGPSADPRTGGDSTLTPS